VILLSATIVVLRASNAVAETLAISRGTRFNGLVASQLLPAMP
jgi:hypothetical protein